MAINDLATRLQSKFKNVPNITLADCTDWVTDAVALHGNETDEVLLLLLAQSEGARNIALNTAHFFSYTDGDESVDKTMLTETYLRVSNDFYTAYTRSKATGSSGSSGSSFKAPKRADR